MTTKGFTWFCMTTDTTDEQARTRFRQLYGMEPQKITRDHNLVWVGPVPGDMAPQIEDGQTELLMIGQS